MRAQITNTKGNLVVMKGDGGKTLRISKDRFHFDYKKGDYVIIEKKGDELKVSRDKTPAKTIKAEQKAISQIQGQETAPFSKSNPPVWLNIIKSLIKIAVSIGICILLWKFVINPLLKGFSEGVQNAVDSLEGRGSSSNVDPRGLEYKNNWAPLSTYDNTEEVAKIYYETTGFSRNAYVNTGTITGRLLNNTGKDLSYISIEYGLYSGDAKYGSCYDNLSNLKAGGTWNYEATCLTVKENTKYRIEEITWY